MRIAMVSEHASPLAALGGADAGGQNVHVAELARTLGRLGHEVTVHTRRTDPEAPETVPLAPRVSVHHVPAGPPEEIPKDLLPPYMAEFAGHLGRIWAADPPDVVHAHFWMSGRAALKAVSGTAIPVVQTFHALGDTKRDFQRDRDTSPPERIETERSVAQAASFVLATSTEESRRLRSWGVAADRVAVVPCGVDLERFTPHGPAAPLGERPRVVSLGRLVERKGIETVVRALAAVPEAELVIAGGGAAAPDVLADPEARRLRGIAEAVGVADRVEFTGRLPREEVPALLRSAQIAVNVPWYEPFGMCTVEAMACGVPVIAAAVGGHVDTVVHGTTGVLIPPRSPHLLAAQLRVLLADPLLRERYGIAAANRASACFSWDRIARMTARHYRELTASADTQEAETAAATGAR